MSQQQPQALEDSISSSSSLSISQQQQLKTMTTMSSMENPDNDSSSQQFKLPSLSSSQLLNNSSSESEHIIYEINQQHDDDNEEIDQEPIITSGKEEKNQSSSSSSLSSRVSKLIDSIPLLKSMLGWLACIAVHTLFGIHPIFSRYLQSTSPNKFPPMLLVTSCHVAAILLYSPRIVYLLIVYLRNKWKNRKEIKEMKERTMNDDEEQQQQVVSNTALFERIKKRIKFFLPIISFFVSLVLRSFTNVVSSKYTSALFVQLFALTTPFILAFLTVFVYNRWFIRDVNNKEKFGLKAGLTMVVTFVGGAIIIIGSIVPKSENVSLPWYSFIFTYQIDFNSISENITLWDLLGIASSIISSVCLVWYMLSLRYMKQEESQGNAVSVTGESLFILQLFILALTFVVPSLIVDDWTLWTRLNTKDWIMFFGFTIFVYMMANHLNIFAISMLGSTRVGSMLALRLISTIFFSILILQESLKSIWQLLGCIIVLASVSYFMYSESQQEKKSATVQQPSPQEDEEEHNSTEMDTVELITRDSNENSQSGQVKNKEGDIMVH
ncbi:predicted protein [Naegleria gruberi]|uniref:Predicted protein n=1 Tax=Naegleria gruberi TaxID=5762 RepID=D2W0W0_NAEGR|nr:uncharacterized protein NAEGRDRAFT_81963 [Naegleria gruberi]EFC37211.1 predicted protein [Naegleria gruberi]|eukprot:XP_002669955.1 predicted protein [Naegleria gruberi strain NEG-M]